MILSIFFTYFATHFCEFLMINDENACFFFFNNASFSCFQSVLLYIFNNIWLLSAELYTFVIHFGKKGNPLHNIIICKINKNILTQHIILTFYIIKRFCLYQLVVSLDEEVLLVLIDDIILIDGPFLILTLPYERMQMT